MTKIHRKPLGVAVAALFLALGAASASAQNSPRSDDNRAMKSAVPASSTRVATKSDDAQDAVSHIDKALTVVRKMESDPHVKDLLQRSKGVVVIPDYGRAALGVGGQGGAGVLLVHEDGKWSGPGFYNFGGVSVGAQVGIAAGQIAMILMDDKALQSFATNNKFSLNADAGLAIVNYSARAHGELGRGDIVMWSDTEGAFANLSVSVTAPSQPFSGHAGAGRSVTTEIGEPRRDRNIATGTALFRKPPSSPLQERLLIRRFPARQSCILALRAHQRMRHRKRLQ
jgi:lipid-binding SYLF domain-containing protein